jgi:hypothetical protein
MDTLDLIQSILNLGIERDRLRDQCNAMAIMLDQAGHLRARCETQSALIDELRASNVRLHAELDAVKAAPTAIVSESEQTHMTREEILSVAREALESGRQVRVTMSSSRDEPYTTTVYKIDDSKLPICLGSMPHAGWEYLACEGNAISGISRLELL